MFFRTVFSMNMVKSRLLGRNTLSSTIVGIVPREPKADVRDQDQSFTNRW